MQTFGTFASIDFKLSQAFINYIFCTQDFVHKKPRKLKAAVNALLNTIIYLKTGKCWNIGLRQVY